MNASIKRIGPKPPEINREYKKRPKPVSGYGKYIRVLPTNYKPAPTYEIQVKPRPKAKPKKVEAEAEKPKRKPRQNRVWTPEKIARFKELYAQGMTYPAIAKEMGMKPTQINAEAYYLRELGEIGERLPCNLWSDEEVERLHELRKQGLSVAKCAKALHRSTGSVDARLRREAEKC